MVRNEEKYQLATHYRKQGFSYSEIANLCGVSKSTVSAWLSKKRFSKAVRTDNAARAARDNGKRTKLLAKARQAERTTRYKEAIRSAETEFKHYKKDPFFLSACFLYLESGDTSDSPQIRLSSQVMTSHRLFVRFAVEYLGVEKGKVRFWALVPANVTKKSAETAWQKATSLPLSSFGKTQQTKQPAKQLHFGTGNTIIGSTVLKRKLLRWIELTSKELGR